MSELQDTSLKTEALQSKTAELNSSNVIYSILSNFPNLFPNVSKEIIIWCHKIVNTRSFAHKSSSLVPFGDFFNHGISKTTFISDIDIENDFENIGNDEDDDVYMDDNISFDLSFYELFLMRFGVNERNSCINMIEKEVKLIDEKFSNLTSEEKEIQKESGTLFLIKTGKNDSYKAGDQIFIPYGSYSNRILLLHYGFSLSDNKFNYAMICLNIKEIIQSQTDQNMFFKIKETKICMKLLRVLRGLL